MCYMCMYYVCVCSLSRPEAAPVLDLDSSRLQGFAASEVEPLLRRLEMLSLVKDLHKMQDLMGGQAAPDPQLTTALGPALKHLATSLDKEGHSDTLQQQEAAAPLGPDSQIDVLQTAAPQHWSKTSPSSANSDHLAKLPEHVAARLPCVRLVVTLQEVQALAQDLEQLQHVSWDVLGWTLATVERGRLIVMISVMYEESPMHECVYMYLGCVDEQCMHCADWGDDLRGKWHSCSALWQV